MHKTVIQNKQRKRLNWGISDERQVIPGTWRAKLTRTESASSVSPVSGESNRSGRLWGRTMSSEPFGMWSEARSPRPVSPSWAILRDWWTNPPSLRTHLIRSGGCGTSLDDKEGETEAMEADDSGRKWVNDTEATAILEAAMFCSQQCFPPVSYCVQNRNRVTKTRLLEKRKFVKLYQIYLNKCFNLNGRWFVYDIHVIKWLIRANLLWTDLSEIQISKLLLILVSSWIILNSRHILIVRAIH